MKMETQIKNKIFERDKFSCQKCGFKDQTGEELEILEILNKKSSKRPTKEMDSRLENFVTLCSICHKHSPNSEKDLKKYLTEKIDSSILETFRRSKSSISDKTKKRMNKLFLEGKQITKAPLGYKVMNKSLVPKEDSYIIREIYQIFLNTNSSLTQLAKKYELSVNGLKKVLSNETYLGKIKFAGKVLQGKHPPLITQKLFDKVQQKLSKKPTPPKI